MSEPIAAYLNDHLAGSVAALELLEHLEKAHAGDTLGTFFKTLRADIEVDRVELEGLIERLGVAKSGVRRAVAWLAEKVARLKLAADGGGGPLHLLEATEAIAVGVHGKGSLWRALKAASETAPALRGPDYQRLAGRADEQRDRIEAVRLDAARAALGGQTTSS